MTHTRNLRMGATGTRSRIGTALVVVALIASAMVGPSVARAQTPGVNLRTGISGSGRPVAAGLPTSVLVQINNEAGFGGATATNAALVLDLPDGAQLLPSPPNNCSESAGTVRCPVDELGPTSGVSFSIPLRFDDTGTFVLTTSATADQADVDDDSSAELEVVVVEEEADLTVPDTTERALTGTVHRIRHFIHNDGPTDSGPVSVTGTFPAGATVVPDSVGFAHEAGDGDRCTVTATGYTCESTVGPGFSGGIELAYDATMPEQPATLEAGLTVTGRNDPDPTNDTGTTTLEVGVPVVELGNLWLALPDVMAAGEPYQAYFEFHNNGDGAATDVEAVIEVPAGWGIAPTGDPRPGRTCVVEPSGTLLRCTFDSVPGPSGTSFRAAVTPPADGPGTGTLEARIEAAGPGPVALPDPISKAVRYLLTGADLVAGSATHRPETPRTGDRAWVTWTFRNDSPSRLAQDLTAAVDLPPGVSARTLEVDAVDRSTMCNLSPDTRTATCPLDGDVAVDEIRVVASVVFETGGSYPFTATLRQGSDEQAPGDESLTHTVEVETARADLQLQVVASADEVTVGDAYSSIIVVHNAGPHPVRDAVISDELPADVELLSAALGWRGEPCAVGNRFACANVELAPGQSTFVVVEARATAAGTVTSAPTVSSAALDPDPGSNTAPATIEVVEPGDESPTDLAVTATPRTEPVIAGEPVTTVVEIANQGSRATTGVTLTLDGGPTNLEVVSATQGWFQLDCATDGATVCTIPTIYAGGSTFVEVTTRSPQPGPFDATLTVGSDQADPDPANDTVTLAGEATESS